MLEKKFEALQALEISEDVVTRAQIDEITNILQIRFLSNNDLQHVRNEFVKYMVNKIKSGNRDYKDERLLSGVTAVIDQAKWHRNMKV